MDNQHRFQMDKLFETWIVPVPGSHTPEPVFEVQYTKPIQDALTKWRSVVYKQQQDSVVPNRLPGQSAALPARPPQFRPTLPQQSNQTLAPRSMLPVADHQQSQAGTYPNFASAPHQPSHAVKYPSISTPPISQGPFAIGQQTNNHYPASYSSTPVPLQQPPAQLPQTNQQQLTATLDTVMKNAAEDYTKNPTQQTGDLLRTLDGLRMVLKAQALPQAQVDSIYRELQRIGADFMPKELAPAIAMSAAQLIALLGVPAPTPSPVNAQPANPVMAPTQPVPLPPANHSAPSGSIFDQLLAAGLVNHTPAPTPSAKYSGVSLFNPASLKVHRPDLIARLYESQPDQCRQCGRRFAASPAGKKHKASHLDWHFQVNSRVAEANKSVIHRSWYIEEREWIDYREDRDGLPITSVVLKGTSQQKPDAKTRWVPAPADNSGANDHCPICTESFEKAWDKDADRPVWTDCVKVGLRYLHASCYEDFSKATAMAKTGSASGRNTPEPLLGKRKAGGGEIRGRNKSPRI